MPARRWNWLGKEWAMPIHDWSRVSSGTFHNFHLGWIVALRDALNAGGLPPDYFAMAEQVVGRPDATATVLRPQIRFLLEAEEERYSRLATHLAIHHGLGQVVAILEIVSPGNKSSRHALRSFTDKAVDLIRQGVNLLVIDLLPPGPRDPQGIHPLIWNEIGDGPFVLPPEKPLTLVAYRCGTPQTVAYIDPVAVGDRLPEMPLFLYDERYVQPPLEPTYQAAWDVLPLPIKRLFDGPSA
jgi:hypothetical protein